MNIFAAHLQPLARLQAQLLPLYGVVCVTFMYCV